MIEYIIVIIICGILFGVIDGLFNANPLAKKLYNLYNPIAKISINVLAVIMINIIY